jgi:hypothetical protein
MAGAGAIGVLAIGLLSVGHAPSTAPAAEPSLSERSLDLLEVSPADRRRLGRGAIVSYPVAETSDREIALGLAMFVLAPVRQLADYLAAGELITADAAIETAGLLPDPLTAEALSEIRFARGEHSEAQSFLDASPGLRFNLSPAEIEAVRARRASTPSAARASEIAGEEYRRILAERWRAYRQRGLAGVPPYTRGDGVTDPSAELRRAAADADRLARHGRDIREALLQYPAVRVPGSVERFYWIRRQAQRRPMLSLVHQVVLVTPDLVTHVERFFYVGHSYNAAQIITGAVTQGDGAVVFATCRFSTDEVLGIGNHVKRTVGRSQMRDEMHKRLERVRAAMTQPPSVQSP